MTTLTDAPALIDAARVLAPAVEAARDEGERNRSLAPSLMQQILASRILRAWVPRSLGGHETDPETFLRVIEEVARMDGAVGWNVMIMGSGGLFAGYLQPEAARTIYGADDALVCGAFAPKGRADAADGGFRVSGRWPLASGCQHAKWLGGGCIVMDGDKPRMGPNGIPDITLMLAPADQWNIIDTWHSGGLRGTGSHDIEIRDAVVPAAHTLSVLNARPHESGPLYRGDVLDFLSAAVACVALGIARAAIDDLEDLAGAKVPAFTTVVLRNRPAVQEKVAEAEATLRSARAFLFETIGNMWQTCERGDAPPEEQRAMVRLASAHAARASAEAVDIAYRLGGSTSVYTSSKLERCFRDVHTVTQHVGVNFAWYERVGSYFLGLGFKLA